MFRVNRNNIIDVIYKTTVLPIVLERLNNRTVHHSYLIRDRNVNSPP